jgi:hypothetical protein
MLKKRHPAKRRHYAAKRSKRLDWREHTWEKGISALSKFKAREDHCQVPRHYVEGDYRLGQWVSVQRLGRDSMSAERRKRLDAIGFVWDWREYLWENGIAALTKFKARKGHCRVPSLHIERKFKLGQWVSVQRSRGNAMSVERRRRLDAFGFVWDRFEYAWEQRFVALTKFKTREGHCRVPSLHIEGKIKLGPWVIGQRSKKDKMPAKRRTRLNKIEFVWRAR